MAHHLSPHDVVPALREDLEPLPTPSGTGADIITLAPVEGAGAMRMHGFELSIARMLDGRRTAQDVIVNARRLGLPITMDALEDFVGQLRSHGLLGSAPVGDEKLDWQPAVRGLYRDALRSAREGHFDLARRHLAAMEELAPGTAEARELRQWINGHPDPLIAGNTFGETFQRTLDSWREERPPHWAAEVRDTARRTFWPFVGPVVAIGFLILYMFLPKPLWVQAVGELSPATSVAVSAPADGQVDGVLVHEGQRVEPGTPLFTVGATELKAQENALEQRLDAARAPLRAQVAKTTEGEPLAASVDRAKDEVQSAQAVLDSVRKDEKAGGAQPSDRLLGAERRLAQAKEELASASQELDARIPRDAPGVRAVNMLTAELAEVRQKLDAQTVKAPAAGVVQNLKPDASGGEPVLLLTDSERMKLVAPVQQKNVARVQVGTPIAVRIGHDHLTAQVSGIAGDKIEAEITNPNHELPSGPIPVRIQLPPPGKR